ncbi:MAG: hypothetical protein GXP26_11945 [Planctomycetes bacterium]|nr:hypothetical protein [Planctomycetota bacterium]
MKLKNIDIGKIYAKERDLLLMAAERAGVRENDCEDAVHNAIVQLIALSKNDPERDIDNMEAYLTTCVKNRGHDLAKELSELPRSLKKRDEHHISPDMPSLASPERIAELREIAEVLRNDRLLSREEKKALPIDEDIIGCRYDLVQIPYLSLILKSRIELNAFDQLLFRKLFVEEMSLTEVSKDVGQPIQEIRAAEERIRAVLRGEHHGNISVSKSA